MISSLIRTHMISLHFSLKFVSPIDALESQADIETNDCAKSGYVSNAKTAFI